MKNSTYYLTLLVATLSLETVAFGAVCKVDRNCRNADYPFRVIEVDSGINVTGECSATFDDAIATFKVLEETGQCSSASEAPQCVVNGLCNNREYSYQVVFKDSSENVAGVCHSDFEDTIEVLKGLQYTGQCSSAMDARRCSVDRRCGNSEYPYRVFYADDESNILNKCYASLEASIDVFRRLKSVGQCLSN